MSRWVVVIALLGCRGTTTTHDAALGECKKVGDSCEYAPGKLGLCVDGNVTGSGPPKILCQSQH